MSPLVTAYAYLFLAILLEVTGTSFLKASQQFTRPLPSLITIAAYVGTFYVLTLSLRTLPLGLAYAVWAGVGIILVALVGVIVYRQPLDAPAVLGIALIVAGVVVLNVFSGAVRH